jgi:hypothetical protein
MTVALAMIVKNEEAVIGRALTSARELADRFVVVDTGSTDDTDVEVWKAIDGRDGVIIDHEWDGFGPSLNVALAHARDRADWILRLDADMTIEAHPGLKDWLASDPDLETDAWNVLVEDHGLTYRLPLLVRGGMDWEYKGPTHEWLDAQGRKTRSLLGLTVTHHGDGSNRQGKLERDLALLAPGVATEDPRSVFYTAECLRFLLRHDEAIEMYERRGTLGGFEEERWYALYQAARLRQDVAGLVEVWRLRPWRHEPLTAAAQIVGAETHDDLLFVEGV